MIQIYRLYLNQPVAIWNLSECIEGQILYIWTIFIFSERIFEIQLAMFAKWMFDHGLQQLGSNQRGLENAFKDFICSYQTNWQQNFLKISN